MDDRIFREREKAMEEAYFRQNDGKLIESLRQKAQLDEIAVALRDKLQIDNPDLLMKARELGVTIETSAAFFLAPLVQVAWADGKVSHKEHDAVLRIAQQRGLETGSPAHQQLEQTLNSRPSDSYFETALEVIRVGFGVLPSDEREERINDIVAACQEVARTAASLGRTIGIAVGVPSAEGSVIDHIAKALHGRA
jgi:tellurite resistance protein